MTALDLAIDTAESLTDFASKVGVSPQVIANWRKRGSVPAGRVLEIERATADKHGRPRVTRHDLRPDIYPEERA